MWLKKLTEHLLARPIHATVLVVVLGVLPPVFASVTAVIVGLVTLVKGMKAGGMLCLWAILPYVAQAYVGQSVWLLAAPVIGLGLIWLSAGLLRVQANWSLLLRYLAILSVLVVLGVHYTYPQVTDFWVTHIYQYAQAVTNINKDDINHVQVVRLASIVTGLQVFIFALSTSFKLMVARWLQAMLYNPGGLRKELYHIRVDKIVLALAVILTIMMNVKYPVAADALVPVCGVFLAAGLSLLHFTLKQHKYGLGLLILFYVVSAVLPYLLITPMFAALVDMALDFRSRISLKNS